MQWQALPAGLLEEVAHRLAAAQGGELEAAMVALRLTCTRWWQALPLGGCLPGMRGRKNARGSEWLLGCSGRVMRLPLKLAASCAGLSVPARVWEWQDSMHTALAPHCSSLEVR